MHFQCCQAWPRYSAAKIDQIHPFLLACSSQDGLRIPPSTLSDNFVSLRPGTAAEACADDRLTDEATAVG